VRNRVVIRSRGYIALCNGIIAVFLLVSVGAILDPTLEDTRDPNWMFWAGTTVLVALLTRAPFVGLVIRGGRLTRHSWVRSYSWSKDDILQVGPASYSGALNRGSQSGRFRMIVLTVRDGSDTERVEVPEVSGSRRKVEDRLRALAAALDLPEPSPPGRHRPD
jgi:hypothetical protein